MRFGTKRPALRGGFTLVEMLVAIGIIIVLIAIVAMGVRHTRTMALRQETRVELKLCEDLLAEYKAVNGYKNILGPPDSVVTGNPIHLPTSWITGQFNSPMFVYPKNNGYTEVTAQVNNPVSTLTIINFKGAPNRGPESAAMFGSYSDTSDPNNPRWVSDAIRWTQGVMFLLLKDPKNRALISNLPPTRLLESMPAPIDIAGNVIGTPWGPPYTIDAAVPLDGWRNPILFVPPGGMHVWMDPTGANKPPSLGEYIVRTSGVYQAGNAPPVGPNDHPFFVSAGMDGYFTNTLIDMNSNSNDYASDNLYSFQEQ